jgi:ParB family chromosome partitioning protein
MSDSSRRRGLGRGLDALIVNTDPTRTNRPSDTTSHDDLQPASTSVRIVALHAIRPNPKQPRSHFDEASLSELAASIRSHGMIQPLIVTADAQNTGMFWLVAGERRWRAAQLAGLTDAPALVREATPQQLLELALIENVQRADLNALEEANAYHVLMVEFGLTQAEVAERVGKSRPAIANSVRLLQLPPSVQAAVINGQISPGHARTLLALTNPGQIENALVEIIQHDLNVRQTEALVKRLLADPQQGPAEEPVAATSQVQAHLAHMEDRFRAALGTRISLNRNPDGSGKLVVHFYSDSDLEAIYALIAGDEIDE